MNLFIAIIGSIAAIFSVIILHELGHYGMARVFGIKILRFSIGFGKALWKRVSKNGTEYIFAILPLGGYVKMLGEGEEVTAPEESSAAYNKKPVWVRMAIVIAGPVVNFIIAVIALWGVYLMGVNHIKPIVGTVLPHSIALQAGLKSGDEVLTVDGIATYNWQRVMMAFIRHMGEQRDMVITVKPQGATAPETRVLVLSDWVVNQRHPNFFRSIGITPYQPKVPPVIAKVVPNSPAVAAGLTASDRILAINGKLMDDWNAVVTVIQKSPNQLVRLTILRNQRRQEITSIVGQKMKQGQAVGYLGVLAVPPKWPAGLIQSEKYSVLSAWVPAVREAWTLTKFNFLVLAKMLAGKISIHMLGGPVTVFQAAGEASLGGWQVYLGFIGFISLTIGFINLLPIPGLDGGHLLFQIIESILRRPVSERIQMVGFALGMIFLVFLMVQATINDLLRLFF